MRFNSTIINVPGWTNSGELHWQSLWEKQHGFLRINHQDWDQPLCSDWIESIETFLADFDLGQTLLIGHSLGCVAIACWAEKYQRPIKGALLVAPCDTEAPGFPEAIRGFNPMPGLRLPFKSILVSSTNDEFLSVDRARHFCTAWGSETVNIGAAGHINTASRLGNWEPGLELLKKLDRG